MQASSPTEVALTQGLRPTGWFLALSLAVGVGFIPPAEPCGNAGFRLATGFARHRRAGVHARRTAAIQNRGVRAAARPAGRPPRDLCRVPAGARACRFVKHHVQEED